MSDEYSDPALHPSVRRAHELLDRCDELLAGADERRARNLAEPDALEKWAANMPEPEAKPKPQHGPSELELRVMVARRDIERDVNRKIARAQYKMVDAIGQACGEITAEERKAMREHVAAEVTALRTEVLELRGLVAELRTELAELRASTVPPRLAAIGGHRAA